MGKCLFHNGKCVEYCPPNMHPYHTRCDMDALSQKTCSNPESYVLGFTCGWSRCDCNGDLVLSDHEGCIPASDCKPGKLRAPGAQRKRRRGKKFRLKTDDDIDEMHRGLDPVHMMGDMVKHQEYVPYLPE
ncbi:hypothetical protein NE865_03771 [Phthorimaea operculella]|nr:hypothetical protein NE865_03771 [Phthorimaea operculella]